MNLLELFVVLFVIGGLMALSVRLRLRSHTVLLLIIIGVLILAVFSLGKIVSTLFGAVVVLGLIVIVFVFRHRFADKLLGGDTSKRLERSCGRVRGFQ